MLWQRQREIKVMPALRAKGALKGIFEIAFSIKIQKIESDQ
jgi:hypothetical protein